MATLNVFFTITKNNSISEFKKEEKKINDLNFRFIHRKNDFDQFYFENQFIIDFDTCNELKDFILNNILESIRTIVSDSNNESLISKIKFYNLEFETRLFDYIGDKINNMCESEFDDANKENFFLGFFQHIFDDEFNMEYEFELC